MSHLSARIAALAATIVLCGSPVVARAVTFSDGDFLNANWSGSIAAQMGPAPTLIAGQVTSGGNPDAFRRVQHTYGGLGSIVSAHVFSSIYDPTALGAIGSLHFEFDLNLFNGGDSNGVLYRALLTQGMTVYAAGALLKCSPAGASAPCVSTALNVWTSHDLGLFTATDFFKVSGAGPATPDFSASGSPIRFGFYASNGTGVDRPTSTSSGIDNWSVDINPVGVPEPGTLLLVAAGAGVAILLERRRRA